MTGTYSQSLVVFSLLVAILASYTALDMAGRLASTRGRVARWWLAGGAGAMGSGATTSGAGTGGVASMGMAGFSGEDRDHPAPWRSAA